MNTRQFLMSLMLAACMSGMAYTSAQTNAVLQQMLEGHLVRRCFNAETQTFRPGVALKRTQAEFFAGDAVWPEDDRRNAFDWYLANLNTTAQRRGLWTINPLGAAAVA